MTTTATLPAALQGKYEIVKPISGGPVFAFPHLGISNIDFRKLTEKQAEMLVVKGWKGIRRVEAPPRPSPQGEGDQLSAMPEPDTELKGDTEEPAAEEPEEENTDKPATQRRPLKRQ